MNLEEIAHLRGLGPSLLFAVDTLSSPGNAICHFVRCETIVFPVDDVFNATEFRSIGVENDARIGMLQRSFNSGK